MGVVEEEGDERVGFLRVLQKDAELGIGRRLLVAEPTMVTT